MFVYLFVGDDLAGGRRIDSALLLLVVFAQHLQPAVLLFPAQGRVALEKRSVRLLDAANRQKLGGKSIPLPAKHCWKPVAVY